MKLRYLHIRNYPPLNKAQIVFSSHSPLDRLCAIRFVVGVNGSGKSHLLRAISKVFLSLADWCAPHFPVSLVYELGQDRPALGLDQHALSGGASLGGSQRQTIILSALREEEQLEPALWVSEGFTFPPTATHDDFEELIRSLYAKQAALEPLSHGFRTVIAPGNWPSGKGTAQLPYLPRTVLAYTTGALASWQSLWERNSDSEGVDRVSQADEYDPTRERPPGWNRDKEHEHLLNEILLQDEGSEANGELMNQSSQLAQDVGSKAWEPILVTPELLKFAVLSVALPVGLNDVFSGTVEPDLSNQVLRELLSRAGWKWPVSVAVTIDFQPDGLPEKKLRRLLPWFYAAGEVIAQPNPSSLRILHYDIGGEFDPDLVPDAPGMEELHQVTEKTQGYALLALIGNENNFSAYQRFQRLCDLHEEGLIAEISFCLRKDDSDDLIRFDELSDGEQMVLGRMALFHLLEDQQDALLLLDEPETHFNDLWKRDIVSVVDEALGKTSCEVIIATHAALVLTDALKDELIVLERTRANTPNADNGTMVRLLDQDIHTFGATGDHPLRDIFGAQDTVGRRASRLMEVLIAAASLSDCIEAQWKIVGETIKPEIIDQVLAVAKQTEPDLTPTLVKDCLASIEHFALHFGAEQPLRMVTVLEAFIRQTGPGYFQVELKRAWRRLKERDDHAA